MSMENLLRDLQNNSKSVHLMWSYGDWTCAIAGEHDGTKVDTTVSGDDPMHVLGAAYDKYMSAVKRGVPAILRQIEHSPPMQPRSEELDDETPL